jgi:hypothetical protein
VKRLRAVGGAALGGLALGLCLAGCSGGSDATSAAGAAAGAPTGAVPSGVVPTGTSTATNGVDVGSPAGSGSPGPRAVATGVGTNAAEVLRIIDRSGRKQAGFSSPTGNITCSFEARDEDLPGGSLRCEIGAKSWQPPPRPTACELDWGFGITLVDQAQVLCAGDTNRGDHDAGTDGSFVLPYGTAMQFGSLRCASRRSGIDCANTRTGSGFLLARERYELRNP